MDFLLDEASDQILPSGVAAQHHALFSRSLEVLSETLRRDIYSLSTPGFSIDQISPSDPDPLSSIRYSCVYWVDHLGGSNSTGRMSDTDLQDGGVVHDFIQLKCLYWLESLSLLHSMSEGVQAVHKLEALVRNTKSQQLAELVQDARRFILSHKRPVEIAPLQIYASALVFSPRNSLIRTLFEKEEPDWILSKPLMEGGWNACLQTLEGHGDSVSSVVFSADGQRLASGSGDNTIKIWDATTGACVQTLEIGRTITYLSFDPMTSSRLFTNIGSLNFDLPALPPTIMSKSTEAPSRVAGQSGYCVSMDGIWILKDYTRMLWLPPESRAGESAVVGSTVAIGCRSGRVLAMKFSSHIDQPSAGITIL